jgi:hypothetical protein
MAKKYEFQPDKPYATWLSKLQLTKQQQKQVLKWCLYALVLIILSLLQDVVLCRFRFLGGTTALVPCGIFTICMLEDPQQGSIFALVSSYLFVLSGSSPGAHVIVLITVLSVLLCAIQRTYLQVGFLSVLFSTILAMAIYELAIFGFCLLVGQVPVGEYMSFVMPAVFSVATVPVIYPFAKAIHGIGGNAWKE